MDCFGGWRPLDATGSDEQTQRTLAAIKMEPQFPSKANKELPLWRRYTCCTLRRRRNFVNSSFLRGRSHSGPPPKLGTRLFSSSVPPPSFFDAAEKGKSCTKEWQIRRRRKLTMGLRWVTTRRGEHRGGGPLPSPLPRGGSLLPSASAPSRGLFGVSRAFRSLLQSFACLLPFFPER